GGHGGGCGARAVTGGSSSSQAWGDRRGTSRDVVAGLSVALLIIPQSMAYAELAGLPSVHGLYASAVPLLAAGLLAYCPYLQTGPVALTALLTHGALVAIAVPGSSEYVGAAALLALVVGLTRLVIGFIAAGKVTYLMSQPVLRGFTSGASILILLSQFPSTLGMAGASESGLVGRTLQVLGSPGSWSLAAAMLTALTVAATLLARRIHVLFPGALVAVIGGVLFAVLFDYRGPVVGEIPGSFPPFSLVLPWEFLPQLVVPGAVIAFVGFAESTAIARGFATQDRVTWDPDREFVSQGAANVASGLFGGMPVDGSFSRSSLNHLSGAQSRWSGAVTGLAVLVFLPFAGVLSSLPRAVLAGIVIAAVAGLVKPRLLVSVWRLSRIQALVVWFTLAMCLLLAPRIEQALLLGILVSLAIHVWRERRAGFHSRVEGGVLHLEVIGILWFASAPRLEEAIMARLARATDVSEVVIHLEGLGRIDLTGALVLKRVVEELGGSGIPATLTGVPPQARELIDNVFGMLPHKSL
ncbi:MAG: SulP family inorganic anion transporter, partial [Gemmatimonadetes bacterium]|nr:SulP family inorganic anion transporter [Gemmatimonadota bacterium]